MRLKAGTCLQPTQTQLYGLQSAPALPKAGSSLEEAPSGKGHIRESKADPFYGASWHPSDNNFALVCLDLHSEARGKQKSRNVHLSETLSTCVHTSCQLAAFCAGSKAEFSLFWLAELGKPESPWMFAGMNNILDVSSTGVGIVHHWQWSWSEKEVALYDSKHLVCPHGATLVQHRHVSCEVFCLPITKVTQKRRLRVSVQCRSSCPLL